MKKLDFRVEFSKEILDKIFYLILRDLSLNSLSKSLKVNYSTIKQWKRGDRILPYEIFIKLKKFTI